MATKRQGISREELAALMAALSRPVAPSVTAPRNTPVTLASAPVAKKPAPRARDTSYEDWLANRPKNKAAAKGKAGKKNDPSTFQRVLDVLSRGNYASAEAFRAGFEGDGYDFTDAVKGFGQGLTGKKKTRFADVLRQEGNAKGHEGKVGFALDIFADPLTYLGVGLVSKGARAVEGTTKVTRALERSKPDVVQLAELAGRGGKAVVRKVRGGSTKATDIVPVGSRGAPLAKGSVPGAAAKTRAAAVAIESIVPPRPVLPNTTNTGPKRPAEFGTADSPELIAKINADIAASISGKSKPAPVAKSKPAQVDPVAAQKSADEAYDKLYGVPGGDTVADLREAVAFGNKKAADALRLIDEDPKYQTMLKARLNKKTGPAAAIVQKTDEVPDVLADAGQRSVEAARKVDTRDLPAIEARVKETLDTMKPGGQNYTNLATGQVGKSRGPHTDFAPEKQANLFQKISNDLLKRRRFGKNPDGTQRSAAVLRTDAEHFEILKANYRAAENAIEAAGKLPRAGRNDPTPLRLSLFLDKLTPADVFAPGAPAINQILNKTTGIAKYDELYDRVYAGAKLQDSAQAAAPLMAVTDAVKAADTLAPDVAKAVLDGAPAAVAKAAKEAGASKAAQTNVQGIIKSLVFAKADEIFDPVTKSLDGTPVAIERALREGRPIAEPLMQSAITADKLIGIYIGPFPVAKWNATATAKTLRTSPSTKNLVASLEKAADSILLRLSTSRGRNVEGEIVTIGKALQQGRAQMVNVAAAHTVDAARQIDAIFSGKQDFEKLDLFEAAKLDPESPVAARFDNVARLASETGVRADDVALELRKMGVGDNPFAPNGTDGFNAWKNATMGPDDVVARRMIEYETAVDRVATGNMVFSDFAKNFGSMTEAPGFVKVTNTHPALNGIYMRPEDIQYARNLLAITEYARQNPKKGTPGYIQKYDRLLNAWKFMATRMNPQYYVRNGIGEVHIMWMDGVENIPKYLNRSRRVMAARGEVPVNALDEAALARAKPSSVAFTHPKYGEVTQDMVWRAFNVGGARQEFAITDNVGADLMKRKNKAAQAFESVGNYEETSLRLAHFLWALERSKQPTLRDAALEAGARVNRTHGNYGEATDWERKYAKRIIPFYTWQKKVTPILLESALRNPGKAMVYPKLQYAIAQNFGIEPQDTLFPQPDEMMPTWMRDGVQVPYAISPAGNTVMGDPGTPITDQAKENLNHPIENLLGQLTPAAKVPLELSRRDDEAPNGRTYFGGGVPIQDKTDYLLGQIPVASTVSRITRQGPLVSPNLGEDEKGLNWLALLNWTTGARLQENTERRKRAAEFEERDKAYKKRKEAEKKA